MILRSRVVVSTLILGCVASVMGCGVRVTPNASDGEIAPRPVAALSDGGALIAQQVQQPVPVPPSKPPPQKVKIFISSQPNKAIVYWGKKDLGKTPLTIDRLRDSGPMDLILRKDGYFPLHVRAYSFRNDKVGVALTRLSDRMTLFGARKELPPDAVSTAPDPTKPPAPPSPIAPR